MSQELDFSEFRKVAERIEGVKDALPEIKRELVERMGGEMLSVVQGNIGGEGKVKSWQEYHTGSRYGYAAVRAKAETYQYTKHAYPCTQNDKFAVGYITNAIENGHRIRSPSGQQKGRYRYRGRAPHRVPGRYFYKASQAEVDRKTENLAKELAEETARLLEEKMSK